MINTQPPGTFKEWGSVTHNDHGKRARVSNPNGNQEDEYTGTIKCRFKNVAPSLESDDGITVHAFAWFYEVEIYG